MFGLKLSNLNNYLRSGLCLKRRTSVQLLHINADRNNRTNLQTRVVTRLVKTQFFSYLLIMNLVFNLSILDLET